MNTDALDDSIDTNGYLSDFCETFSLKNLILGKTSFKEVSGKFADVMLLKRPRSFQKTTITETGLSDHHKYFAHILLGYHLKKLNTRAF